MLVRLLAGSRRSPSGSAAALMTCSQVAAGRGSTCKHLDNGSYTCHH
jgi:hypothetical protein